jgi:hypothetical protein
MMSSVGPEAMCGIAKCDLWPAKCFYAGGITTCLVAAT